MSVVRPGRDKLLKAAEYVVPSLPIDLCFRSYKSPSDILPEDIASKFSAATLTETGNPPGFKLASTAHSAKPAFITALATGRWPSAGAPTKSVVDDSFTEGGWHFKNEGPSKVSAPGIAFPGDRQQQCGTYGGTSLDTDKPVHQQQQQPLGVHGKAAGLISPSGARVSICVSRQCSIISVCAPPQSLLAGTVLELSKPQKARVKFVIACVRLSNNQLRTLENLIPSLNRLMPSPTNNLQWLDLAHNQITCIDPALEELANLSVLYLHSNLIADFAQVRNLRLLKKLKILTLAGNPVERENYRVYRHRVLALVPQLRVLDYTAVSNGDHEAAHTYERGHAKRKPDPSRSGLKQ